MALGFFSSDETLTPEGVERRRKLVDAMREKSMSTAPIKHWTEGVARLAQALRAGWDEDRLDAAVKAGRSSADSAFSPLLTALGGADAPAASTTPAAMSPAAATAPPARSPVPANVASGKDVYNGLVERGMSPVLAAGFAGNFHGESGFNTGAWGDNGTSYGMGQWRGDRLTALRQLAAQQGKDPSDMGVQLDHVMAELNGPEAKALRLASAAGTPEQAAALIAQHYERPAAWALQQSTPKRAAFARGVFDQYGQPAPASPPVQVASLGGEMPAAAAGVAPGTMMPMGAPQPRLPAGPAGGPMAYAASGQPVMTDADGNAVGAPAAAPGQQAIMAAMGGPSAPSAPSPSGAGAASQPSAPAVAPVQVAQAGTGRAALAAAMGVMNNPWASPGQKAVAQSVLSQAMQPNKLQYQTDGDGNVIALDPTGRQAPQVVYRAAVKPMTRRKGEELINPTTGQVIGTPAVDDDSPTVQRVKQPDGSEVAVQWDKKSLSWVPLVAPQGGNPVATPKLTEQQSKDVGFYNRGAQVIGRLEKQDKALTDRFSSLGGQVPVVGNYLKSDAYRQAEQTGRELLAVILRKDTGAAVTDSEMSLYSNMYLPQPGDDVATIQQKREGRKTAIEGIRMGLGPAEILFKQRQALDEAKSAPTTANEAERPAQPVRRTVGGKAYEKRGDQWFEAP